MTNTPITEGSKYTDLKKYDVTLVFENTTLETLKGEDSNLPSDIHVIYYEEEGEAKLDAVRAYKMSDIFDGYYDRKLKVTKIESGFGKIKPNLYNINKDDKDTKKEKKK